MIKEIFQNSSNILKITASNPAKKDCQFFRIVMRKVDLRGQSAMHVEKFAGKQVFHDNVQLNDLANWVQSNVLGVYKQVCLVCPGVDVTYLFSNGKQKRLQKATDTVAKVESVNRRKNYILNEGDDIPVFVDLGIFTKQFKVVNSMFDKFKQINRFVEILDDCFKNFKGNSLTLLDFGCGKSYLTFVIYHYFTKVKGIDAKIIGYDLKSEVVSHCNDLAKKYRYNNLQFVVADVSKDALYDKQIDAVVSLHACDTATDYALNYAVQKDAKYIFSVPCCQHQINAQIADGGDLDALLKYGIIKERVSALLTDSIRAMLLEDCGYSVDVMEFVDLAHSPKNLMIRATKTHGPNFKNRPKIKLLMEKYRFDQKLYALLQQKREFLHFGEQSTVGVDVTGRFLTTDRLVLRPFVPNDLLDLFHYASDPDVGPMAGWEPHKSFSDTHKVLQQFIADRNVFAISYDGKVIGSVGVHQLSPAEFPDLDLSKGREIGYVLSKEYWGRGIMPEAVRRVIKYLFEDVGLDYVVCGNFADNPQSRRVKEKCGFTFYKNIKYTTKTGEVKDCELSVLKRK